MPKAETVVGWGLGALLLMCAQSKRPKSQKWILLSPFADFCDEDGPWNSENILFKAREMHGSKNVALDAFKDQFGEEFSDWPDEWLEAAQKMDPDCLAEGLRFMVQNRIDRVIENGDDIQVLYGRMDQDVTPAMTLKLKEFLPKATFKERLKSGHWPPMMLF
jgi:pimeloyl-ACP methyl ester carboxylesterase